MKNDPLPVSLRRRVGANARMVDVDGMNCDTCVHGDSAVLSLDNDDDSVRRRAFSSLWSAVDAGVMSNMRPTKSLVLTPAVRWHSL